MPILTWLFTVKGSNWRVVVRARTEVYARSLALEYFNRARKIVDNELEVDVVDMVV